MGFESQRIERPESKFTVSKSGGSEKQPILIFSHNGTHFTFELDLLNNRFREVGNPSFDHDTNQSDAKHLRAAVEEAVRKELGARRENLSIAT